MKIRVYVGTTEGPVAIERITREAAPNSAMCIGRSTREATASAGYEAFVKQPSGVIERELGPFAAGAFRLDVSGEIGDGESWQLGVFVAHALAAEGWLAEYHEEADAALWLTGEVANDLEVRPVGHVPDKLRAARAELEGLAARSMPVTVVVPEVNRDHLDHAELAPGIRRVVVARAREALAAAGLPGRSAGGEGTGVIPAPSVAPARAAPRRRRRAVAAVVVLAGAAASWPIAQLLQTPSPPGVARLDVRAKPAEAPPPPAPDIRLVIRERRAPEGATCAAVHLRRIDARRVEVRRAAPDRFAASRHDGLCGLELAVVNSGAPAYVAAYATVIRGGFLDTGQVPEALAGASPFAGEASWSLDVARRLDGPIEYRLEAVVSATPVTEARAPGDNVTVHRASHRIEP